MNEIQLNPLDPKNKNFDFSSAANDGDNKPLLNIIDEEGKFQINLNSTQKEERVIILCDSNNVHQRF